MVHVAVHGGNCEQAMRNLKRKMQRELVFRSMKLGKFYEKPSARRVREQQEAQRRRRKVIRKKREEAA